MTLPYDSPWPCNKGETEIVSDSSSMNAFILTELKQNKHDTVS